MQMRESPQIKAECPESLECLYNITCKITNSKEGVIEKSVRWEEGEYTQGREHVGGSRHQTLR